MVGMKIWGMASRQDQERVPGEHPYLRGLSMKGVHQEAEVAGEMRRCGRTELLGRSV